MINNILGAMLIIIAVFNAQIANAQSIGQSGTSSVSVTTLPALAAGTNIIGGVYVYDSAGTNKLAVNASGQLALSNFPATQSVSQSTVPWNMAISPQSSATYGLSNVVSSAVETGHVIKASAGNLYAFEVTAGATAGEVLIHNSTTVPSAGAVTPVKCYNLPANNTLAGSWEPVPLQFGTGIAISFSTAATCFTQTNSSTAFISADYN